MITTLLLACRHRVSVGRLLAALVVVVAFDIAAGVIASAILGALKGAKA